jgi:hypothetical protein
VYVAPDFYDPWLLASRLAPDAIIAYDAALLLQRPWREEPVETDVRRVCFLTESRVPRDVSDDITFAPVTPPAPLTHRWRRLTEIRKRHGVAFTITTVERTIVDLLDRIELAPSVFELWEACAHARPSPWRMVEHALALKSQVVAGRVGVFLSHLPGTPPSLLAQLERRAPSSPSYFSRAEREDDGQIFWPRWNMCVPSGLDNSMRATQFRRGSPTVPDMR